MSTFKLPDLGEGLIEAEIVEWFVQPGQTIERDVPLVSVETDKAIVEIPSPQAGVVSERLGEPGDVIQVGDPLVVFGDTAEAGTGTPESSRAASEKPRAPARAATVDSATDEATSSASGRETKDSGTVVGEVRSGTERIEERASVVGESARATPAVRALARRLDVNLALVTPTGPENTITSADVQRAAQDHDDGGSMEPLRGVRRAMARTMTRAHESVVPVTVSDDVDIDAWPDGTDITLRLVRAIRAGCRAEPDLNAWYDGRTIARRVMDHIDLGIAVDTEEGLFVPVLRDVGNRDDADLRRGLDALVADVRARSIPPEEMRGSTITLSNFGTIAGRYADPVVVPPTVAIIGAGRIRPEVIAVKGEPVVHRVMPLSLSFDHRCVTGGEASRFLRAMMDDLSQAE
ncbi:dihydrolipoamide acetyltransferase family protein [Arhodomonas sp. AD133]|uniref:dihydrolipoamide acetyltransferase family protein n=1 Tax=Arhodomonas sp. AD133 TaxID=3415009 RepID=UPI003EBDDDC0